MAILSPDGGLGANGLMAPLSQLERIIIVIAPCAIKPTGGQTREENIWRSIVRLHSVPDFIVGFGMPERIPNKTVKGWRKIALYDFKKTTKQTLEWKVPQLEIKRVLSGESILRDIDKYVELESDSEYLGDPEDN
jgi:hypothetical protein